ncbi:MAG: site-specific integrase [Akkermansia sp.]|nr:site-specific integrase [Akkermansia sp.]
MIIHPYLQPLSSTKLSALDIYRLFVEFTEEAGLMQAQRQDIITTFRQSIRHGLESMTKASMSVPFAFAVRESLHARQHRRASTRADLKSYTQRMLVYKDISGKSLREISTQECLNMLKDTFGHSMHSYRKAKTILHSIFSYGLKQGWCHVNPTQHIALPPVEEERIEILTMSQIKALLRACEHEKLACMAPAIYLMLWCGIRPGEVRRLRWGDIDEHEQMVYIDTRNSKTGGARAVPLRGAAVRLCHMKKHHAEYIAPRNWTRLWQRVRAKAGFQRWQQDALRHTFASFHLKHFHNLSLLQEEMGHRDCSLLRTRYLNLRNLTRCAACQFFSLPLVAGMSQSPLDPAHSRAYNDAIL